MHWRVETHRMRQTCQRTMLIRSRDTNGDSRSLRKSHEAAPPRNNAKPYARQRVCHPTMVTTLITFEGRTNSRPHAGSDGLLLFAHSIGIDGGNFQDGVAHPLGKQIQGNAFIERMDGIAVAQALGDMMGA